jgi:hypothetical protein
MFESSSRYSKKGEALNFRNFQKQIRQKGPKLFIVLEWAQNDNGLTTMLSRNSIAPVGRGSSSLAAGQEAASSAAKFRLRMRKRL